VATKWQWSGDSLEKKIKARIAANMAIAGKLVKENARRLVSTKGYRIVRAVINVGGVRKTRSHRHLGVTTSRPGQSPFKQTGDLQNAIEYKVDKDQLILKVGTNVDADVYGYARALEDGTAKMLPRPWLKKAFLEKETEVVKIITNLS